MGGVWNLAINRFYRNCSGNIQRCGRKYYSKAKIGALILPFFLIMLSFFVFENGYSICLFKNVFGIECPGCGMTRAVFSLLQGDMSKAYHFNKGVYLVFPILSYVLLKNIIRFIMELRDE